MYNTKDIKELYEFSKKSQKAITLISLVITVIVILILAGITINSLSGENGILKRATQAKELTNRAQVQEQLQLEVFDVFAEKGDFNAQTFKEKVQQDLSNINPQIHDKENGDIIVETDSDEFIIDGQTGEIKEFGPKGGLWPEVEVSVTQVGGDPLDEDQTYEEVELHVTVPNEDEFDKEVEITVKDSEGQDVEVQWVDDGQGGKKATVPGTGDYTIEVKGTKDGIEKTEKKTVHVGNKEQKPKPEEPKDTTPPTITSATAEEGWKKENKKITIIAQDEENGSGIAGYAITDTPAKPDKDEGPWEESELTTWESTTTYSAKTYYAWVKDKAGNISNSTEVEVNQIDKTPPTVQFQTNGSSSYKKEQGTIVTVTDIGIGTLDTENLKYKWIEDETETKKEVQETELEDGTVFSSTNNITDDSHTKTGKKWRLWILAKDELGNTTVEGSEAFYFDNTPPTSTKAGVIPTATTITVQFNQTDTDSQIDPETKEYTYKEKSADVWEDWVQDTADTHKFTGLTEQTEYEVKTRAKDMAGNDYVESDPVTEVTTIELQTPQIQPSNNSLTNEDIEVEITYAEIPGTTKQYKDSTQGDDNWKDYTTKLTGINSNRTIYARYKDNQTGETAVDTKVSSYEITNIDKKLPTAKAEIGSAGETVVITVTGEDENGIASIETTNEENIEEGEEITEEQDKATKMIKTFKVTQNGTYNFTITDKAGNKKPTEAAVTNVIKISDTFSTDYGTIDVIWLGTDNSIKEKPNKPVLKSSTESDSDKLTPVKWEGTSEQTTTEQDETWYDYKAGEGKEDNNTSHWANAKNSDGSYFVWIPRFAYRITYYEDETREIITGYCDGKGITDAKGQVQYELDKGIKTVDYGEAKYIVHPAFMDNTENNFDNGGWDSELNGIWIAKYTASRIDATIDSEGIASRFKSVPSVRIAGQIDVGEAFDYGKKYESSKNSHLLKNSEYGALACLTHSQYGRNGHEICKNNNSYLVTGFGSESPDSTQTTETENSYDTLIGQKASTTGNIYGIYDLSGGASEFVAAFDSASNFDDPRWPTLELGQPFASKGGKSSKWVTAYSNGTSSWTGADTIYRVSKIGDLTKEVKKTSHNYKGWFGDYCMVLYNNQPYIQRGGILDNGEFGGLFRAVDDFGLGADTYSFRISLIE